MLSLVNGMTPFSLLFLALRMIKVLLGDFEPHISIDECKERTARLHAKKDCFVKACSSSFHENHDEDLKVIDVSPIKSLFCNMNLNNMGLEMSQL